MENEKMYALIYLYGGTENQEPYSSCLGVSADIGKLKQEMNKWVAKDCAVDDEDEWNEDCNYKVNAHYENEVWREVWLQHKANINLYCKYIIQSVDVF